MMSFHVSSMLHSLSLVTCIIFVFCFFIIPIRHFDSLLCTFFSFFCSTLLLSQLVKTKYGCLGFGCFKDGTLLHVDLNQYRSSCWLFHTYIIGFRWLVTTDKTTWKIVAEHQDFTTLTIGCWAYSCTFLTGKRHCVFQVVGDLGVNL